MVRISGCEEPFSEDPKFHWGEVGMKRCIINHSHPFIPGEVYKTWILCHGLCLETIASPCHGLYALMIRVPPIHSRTRIFSRANKDSRFYVCVADLVEFICAGVITDKHRGTASIQTKLDILRRKKNGARDDNRSETYCPLVWEK